jgi:hypothetical protein
VHPIERLRAIARSDDLPHAELAAEAAAALAALADDPLGLVPACRRLIDRHPDVGPLWWACARLLSADDPFAEARAIRGDLASDQVGLSLALDLPTDATVSVVGWSPLVDELVGRRPDMGIEVGGSIPGLATDVLLVEAWAVGERSIVAEEGTEPAIELATAGGAREIWLVVGVGRRLPEPLFRALRQRVGLNPDPWRVGAEVLDPSGISRTVEPLKIGCPSAPELLRPL